MSGLTNTDSESGPSDSYAQGYDGEGFMEALCNFTHFPALESLVLHFREDDGPFKSDTEGNSDETRFPDSYIIQSLVFNTLAARGFPQLLKSLTIDKYLPLGHPVFGSRSGTAFLSNLNHLAIKTTTQCAALPMTDPRSEVHGNAIFEKAIVPASLVSLEVHHADVRSAGMTIPVEEIHLPRLERLSFQRAYFSELEGGKIQDEMEGFIVRHGSTLRELEIFLCPMALSTTLSGEPPARFRRWVQVWEHLSGELKVLRNLVVSGRHDSKGVEDDSVPRYVDNCYYCNEVELSEAEIVEDESALRLFREKVESRLPQ